MDKNNPYAPAQQGFSGGLSFGTDPQPAAPPPVKDVTTASFTADVIRESQKRPVLVDFWAPWCGPCKQLAPVLEKVVAEWRGDVALVKMNIDEHPAVASQLRIQSIPAVFAFRNGQPVDAFVGVLPESEIRAFITRLAGEGGDAADIEAALEDAAAARKAGDPATAMNIYGALLQAAPDTLPAIAGVADLLADAGELDQAESVLATAPPEKAEAPELAAVRARIANARRVSELGDPTALEARLAADPKDHQAGFDLAMIRNEEGRREEAADLLLAIIQKDRAWNDDGARRQLLQFFEAWGPTDAATLAARRRLSSLLFS